MPQQNSSGEDILVSLQACQIMLALRHSTANKKGIGIPRHDKNYVLLPRTQLLNAPPVILMLVRRWGLFQTLFAVILIYAPRMGKVLV